MPSINDIKIDQRLTDISQAITNESYVADKFFPVIGNLAKRSGKIGKHGVEHLRTFQSKRDPHDYTPHRIKFDYATDDLYYIDDHDVEVDLPFAEMERYEKPFDAREDATKFLTETMMLQQDAALADTLTNAATYATGNTVTLSGSSQFNDFNNSRPENVIESARSTVYKKTAKELNTAIIPREVLSVLKRHPFFIEKLNIKTSYMNTSMVIDMIKDFFELDNVIIAKTLKLTSTLGQTNAIDYAWGKHIILAYMPSVPSLRTPSFGYTFRLAGVNRAVDVRPEPNTGKAELIRVNDSYSMEILNNEAGYLIKNVIA